MYTSDTLILKAINLQLSEHLYDKTKVYADEREIPLVGAIRLILSEFFRNKTTFMGKNQDLPPGIIADMGDGKGLAFDMEMFRDEKGEIHWPPLHLSKQQIIDWVRNFHNSKKNEA